MRNYLHLWEQITFSHPEKASLYFGTFNSFVASMQATDGDSYNDFFIYVQTGNLANYSETKTDILLQAAIEAGMPVIIFHTSPIDPSDYLGFPFSQLPSFNADLN